MTDLRAESHADEIRDMYRETVLDCWRSEQNTVQTQCLNIGIPFLSYRHVSNLARVLPMKTAMLLVICH